MTINTSTLAQVLGKIENSATRETEFRDGMNDLAQQANSTRALLDTEVGDVRYIGTGVETPRSYRLQMLGNMLDTEIDSEFRTMSNEGVFRYNGTASHTLKAAFTTIFHDGTGTMTITATAGTTPDGAAFYVATAGTMTMAYSGTSQGISLGNAAKLASGAYSKNNTTIYFSETVY